MTRTWAGASLAVLAFACSGVARACVPGPGDYSDAGNVEYADAIVIAHVVKLEEVPAAAGANSASYDVRATVRRIAAIKGDLPSDGVVLTSYSDCDVPLLPGGDYVLFIKNDDQQYGGMPRVGNHTRGTRQYGPYFSRSREYVSTIRALTHSPSSAAQ